MDNMVSKYITSTIELDRVKPINAFKNDKFYLSKFVLYILNKIDNSTIKVNMFRNDIINNMIDNNLLNMPIISNNSIISELKGIINESIKNQYSETIFIEKVKEINNIDNAIENIKDRVKDQIIDTISQNKNYQEKMDDMIKEIENKILDGEIEESYYNSKVNKCKKNIELTHKNTLINIIAQKLGESAFKYDYCDKYLNNNELDLNEIHEDSKEIYTLFEIMNSFGFDINIINLLK